jgi:hypothetical protein
MSRHQARQQLSHQFGAPDIVTERVMPCRFQKFLSDKRGKAENLEGRASRSRSGRTIRPSRAATTSADRAG